MVKRNLVKRHRWLLAAGMALYVLQAPLCAFGCLAAPGPASVASQAAEAAPCHGERSAPPAESQCESCRLVGEIDLASAPLDLPSTWLQAVVAPVSFREALARADALAPRPRPGADPPPPDLLLLNSTLLI